MTKAALVKDGVVTNIIKVGEELPDGFIACDDQVSIGWEYVNGAFNAPPVPEKTPMDVILELEAEITNRRLREAFLGQENPEGWLANQEALISAEREKL